MLYTEGYKYQLVEDEVFNTNILPPVAIHTRFINLEPTGILTVRAGYAWDGSSGPTIDTPDSMRGSLAHDALYQLMRMGRLDRQWREAADDLFGRLLKQDGMGWLRRKIWIMAVKKFAGGAADPKNKKRVLIAPPPKAALAADDDPDGADYRGGD